MGSIGQPRPAIKAGSKGDALSVYLPVGTRGTGAPLSGQGPAPLRGEVTTTAVLLVFEPGGTAVVCAVSDQERNISTWPAWPQQPGYSRLWPTRCLHGRALRFPCSSNWAVYLMISTVEARRYKTWCVLVSINGHYLACLHRDERDHQPEGQCLREALARKGHPPRVVDTLSELTGSFAQP